jgi:DNA repair protein RecN (Recombination protein N)
MLESLHVNNFVLIEKLELDFGQALNVLTGETGSGKSIVVGALNLVLGARATSGIVREGTKRAKIDAIFRIRESDVAVRAVLAEHELETDDDELILTRTIGADGRSRAYVGGQVVPLAVLAQIGDELVDLHGQHEHQSLLRPDRQLGLLDAFARTESKAASVREVVAELREAERALDDLQQDDRERARRTEFLRFAVTEIDNANLEPDEENQVKSRRSRIANAEMVSEQAARAVAALYESEDGSATAALNIGRHALDELAGVDERFAAMRDRIDAITGELDELTRDIQAETDKVDFDPAELETLNQRLSQIGDLKRKYGDSIEAVLAYRDEVAGELDGLENRDERLAELQSKVETLAARAVKGAGALTKARKKGAAKLDKEIAGTLQFLGMKDAAFATSFAEVELYSGGIDRIDFMLAPNPGEPARPLKKAASGGEISRVMLAIKAVLAGADSIPTLVFDEVDSGVGGAVAISVAAKLQALGQTHQIISITHLPQIAAAGNAHFQVSKSSDGARTHSAIERIDGVQRVEELARLLDGSVSSVSLEHAKSMLSEALG